MAWLVAFCIALSLAASLVLVPIVRYLAIKVGVVDHPDQDRKLQTAPVALGGGVAVFLALTLAFAATILLDRQWDSILGGVATKWRMLFAAAAAILGVGLIDDLWKLRGRQKLLLQILIVSGLVGSGTIVSSVSIVGFQLELGAFAFPATVLWLLISVNALNLIDGADGMATTAGAIICVGLGFTSLAMGAPLSAIAGFALAGALAGFLVFNRPPASIYLGDAGSMMIGLFVGALAVWSSFKESTVLASAPIAILAIPLFDSTAAILRRWLTGRSIYMTDRAHLHHLLQQKYGDRTMLSVVAGLCIVTTTLSVLSIRLAQPWLAPLGVVIVLLVLVLTRSFGNAEAKLLFGKATHFAQSFAAGPTLSEPERLHRSVPLQGDANWDTVWEPLVEFAKSHQLAQVKIDLNLSWLHEGYHANWQSIKMPDKPSQLAMHVPLFTSCGTAEKPTQIGRLEIIVAASGSEAYTVIYEISDKLDDLAEEIDRIVAGLTVRSRTNPSADQTVKETHEVFVADIQVPS